MQGIKDMQPVDENLEEEFLEEEALSAEELFQQHQAEINERFEEKGFFRRMKEMSSGLAKPRSSAEYKLAKTELQRLMAPLIAIVVPTIVVVALIVITAITGQTKEVIQVTVATAQEDEPELEEDPPEEIEPEEPPEEPVDIQVDTPVVAPVADVVVPSATPVNEPVSVKPATQDSVAIIKSPVQMRSMTGSRSPGSIGKYTNGGAGYGDAHTEAAVMKLLRWLKKTQNAKGSWENSPATTAFVILTYLAHGETPASEEFGSTVERGMQYLIDSQIEVKGRVLFKGSDANEYTTLIVTYALCEAYGMTKNPNAKTAALKSLQRIVDCQSPTGGWDYKLNKDSTRDDLSYAGWAMQAIKAGKMAGLKPEGLDACIKKAVKCLKTRNFRNGGFNYVAGGNPTGLTATGCLCMQLLGYANHTEVKQALDFMREWMPAFTSKGSPKPGGPLPAGGTQYYSYYAAQCKYQSGMCEGATPADKTTWVKWNAEMKKLYTSTIVDDGEIDGPKGKKVKTGYWANGYQTKTMGSCLVGLQLMVYYRYLPTTQTKAGKVENHAEDEEEAPAAGGGKKAEDDVDIEVDI